jgi:hypothetical protein
MFPGKMKNNLSYRSVVVDVKTAGDSLPLPVNVGSSYFLEGHEDPCLCAGIIASSFTNPPRYVYDITLVGVVFVPCSVLFGFKFQI